VFATDLHAVADDAALGSHESLVQPLPSSQDNANPGRHKPPRHVSATVHALLSEQSAILTACAQPTVASQLSVVQGLPSSHPSLGPLMHTPLAQTSPLVHASLSEQGKEWNE